jgi:protein MpaA
MNGWKWFLAAVALVPTGCAAPMQQSQAAHSRRQPTPAAAPDPQLGPARSQPAIPSAPSTAPAESPTLKKPVLEGPLLGYPQAKTDKPRAKAFELSPTSREPGSAGAARQVPDWDPFTNASRSSLLDEPRWERIHRSTDRRPIESVALGTGRDRVVVMSSLHGDETQSIALIDHLARHVAAHPTEFRDASVLFIRTPNPDGVTARSPYNARGVDLNRNFPASNWKADAAKHTGDKAGSEVETRAILRLITDFRPGRLIHVKDSAGGGFVNHDGGLRDLAQQTGQLVGLKVVKDLGRATTGSIESFVATELNVPSLTILLPRETNDQAAWDRNRTALIACILGSSDPFESKPERRRHSPNAPGGSTRESSWVPRSNGGGTRNLANTTAPAFPVPVPDRGYLELPPPPTRNSR